MNARLFFVLVLCCAVPAAAQWDYPDAFEVSLGPDNEVIIDHVNSLYNCCSPVWHEIVYLPELGGQPMTIHVTEIPDNTQLCWCECLFDMQVVINDVPPGYWHVLFEWDNDADPYVEDIQFVTLEITVPYFGQTEPPVFVSGQSECHSNQTIEARDMTFGAIKAIYR